MNWITLPGACLKTGSLGDAIVQQREVITFLLDLAALLPIEVLVNELLKADKFIYMEPSWNAR